MLLVVSYSVSVWHGLPFMISLGNGILFGGRASMYDYLANIEIWRGARRY